MPTTRQTTHQKVLVSRPRLIPAPPSAELRRPDFCWTRDGELLTFPDILCADGDECGCGWSFAGITSARACTWGVVEMRSIAAIAAEVAAGAHLAGWPGVKGFEAHLRATIREIGDRVRLLPVGAMVGLWAIDDDRVGLFERSPAPRPGGRPTPAMRGPRRR